MPALRRRRYEAAVDVVEQRLAKAGSGGDQRDVAATQRLAFLQHVHFSFPQDRDRVGHRLQIVEEPDARHAESRRHLGRVDLPRHVGQLRRFADDRAGDAEGGGRNRRVARVVAVEERGNHRRQIGIVQRAERADRDRPRPRRYRVEQAELRLGAADISCQNHDQLSSFKSQLSTNLKSQHLATQ